MSGGEFFQLGRVKVGRGRTMGMAILLTTCCLSATHQMSGCSGSKTASRGVKPVPQHLPLLVLVLSIFVELHNCQVHYYIVLLLSG